MKNYRKIILGILMVFLSLSLIWNLATYAVNQITPKDRLIIRKEKLSIVVPDTCYYIESNNGNYKYRVFGGEEPKIIPKELATVKFTEGNFVYVDEYEYQCSPNWTNKVGLCISEYKYVFYIPSNGINE